MGTDGFGETTDEKTAFAIMDAYAANGGNHLDTARLYGAGLSEQTIGKWLKGKKRDDFIIATKGAHPNLKTMHIPRLSLEEIESDADESLSALETGEIDLYWLHRDDESVDVGEVMESLNFLIKRGKIKAIGASNWKAERIKKANDYAKEHNLVGFCAGQIRFSPARTAPDYVGDTTLVEMDAKEYAAYCENSVTAVGFASQAKGFFSKYIASGVEGLSQKAKERYYCEENVKKAEFIRTLCEKYKASAASIVCAAMTLSEGTNVLSVIGSKSVFQLDDSISGANIALSNEEVRIIMENVTF